MARRVHYPHVRRSSSMARIIHFLATGALLIGGSVALGQTTERSGAAAQASGQATAGASANQNEQSASLAAGTAVNAQLSQTIDSKKAKAGEPVSAQTTDAVKSGGAASGAASTVPRTVQDQTGAVNSTVGGAANAAGRTQGGLTASGELTPTSRGVFGINGLSLNSNAANSTEGSVITSAGKNVRLDSGTKMLLVTQASTSASAER